MKIIVVGANHAGTSFLRTIKTLDSNVEITAYERNTNTSFLGCGIAIWVAGEFKQPDGLFYSSPEILKTDYGVNLKTEHEVLKIDNKKKEILVKNLKTNEEFVDKYDKLIFAGGTWPIEPKIPGIQYKNIVLSKLFQHAEILVEKANDKKIKDVVVVGAGYIGIELVEAFRMKGKNVTLIDTQDRVVANYLDKEFTNKMEENIKKEKITLALGQTVKEFKSKDKENVSEVITDKQSFKADLVIMSVGFKPLTGPLSNFEKISNGAIKVNEFQQSVTDKDIYVIGDSASMKHCVSGVNEHVALATNAVKSGIVAALDLARLHIPFPGVVGTNAINVFGCHYASTGFTEEVAKSKGMKNISSIYFEDNDRCEFMKSTEKVGIKIVYDRETFKLLGVQIGSWGKANHTEVIYMFGLALQQGLTLPQIALTDVFFLPHFNKPFNFFLVPILKALGLDYKK
ncbi:FAD-dependent oxidoreductase [Mycoplasma sp. Mirounga ES2805-ORL]|uniref:FAD-dependent oxidoreductase n=1 Tax=Mycoplasma sp. Mirounga ES2805-ORL TaxID=754514 RepID=UPI00197BE331|nr:FAD-dependent oxidoreductase [Mycoplasma sp. Mirounga ES2805-ORL]QSF13525.1 FAD-dependent oxidoreductase [Mycoplasma sp. Mirounga ES2805-ORL]